jgi:hypothetical protein
MAARGQRPQRAHRGVASTHSRAATPSRARHIVNRVSDDVDLFAPFDRASRMSQAAERISVGRLPMVLVAMPSRPLGVLAATTDVKNRARGGARVPHRATGVTSEPVRDWAVQTRAS